jgi:hypothetical protein
MDSILQLVGLKKKTYKHGHYWDGKKRGKEFSAKISAANTGRVMSDATKKKIRLSLTGRKAGPMKWTTRHKMESIWAGLRKARRPEVSGDKNGNWANGVTTLNHSIRTCSRMDQWIDNVLTNADYICKFCGLKDMKNQADHIIRFSVLIKKYDITNLDEAYACIPLWDTTNGRCLCPKCHTERHRADGKNRY